VKDPRSGRLSAVAGGGSAAAAGVGGGLYAELARWCDPASVEAQLSGSSSTDARKRQHQIGAKLAPARAHSGQRQREQHSAAAGGACSSAAKRVRVAVE
jgi:hypothetical protein